MINFNSFQWVQRCKKRFRRFTKQCRCESKKSDSEMKNLTVFLKKWLAVDLPDDFLVNSNQKCTTVSDSVLCLGRKVPVTSTKAAHHKKGSNLVIRGDFGISSTP